MQYAANLRNYHPINYDMVPERLEREERKRERRRRKHCDTSSNADAELAALVKADEKLT